MGSVARLYPDLEELRKTEMLQESIRSTGAVVMGKHAFDMAQGDLTGYEYQVPIFVLTHHPPDAVIKGQNATFKNIQLEKLGIFETPSRMDIRFRVVK